MLQISQETFDSLSNMRRLQFEGDLRVRLKQAYSDHVTKGSDAAIEHTCQTVMACEALGLFVQRDNLMRLAFLSHECGPGLMNHPEPYWLSGVLQRPHERESTRLDIADAYRQAR